MRKRTRCVKKGEHVHESGYGLLRTANWGPGERWERWEVARWDPKGDGWGEGGEWTLPGYPLTKTMREAVAWLELEIEAGRLAATVEHPSFSPWPREPAYPIVLDESRLDGTDANGVRWHYDDYLSEGDKVGTEIRGQVYPPIGTVVARADGRLVIELAAAATPEGGEGRG